MDSFHAVFLCFYFMAVVASHVPPPTHVTLHCRNFHNVLKWNYPEKPTGLSFRLDIGAYQNLPDIPVLNTTALQAELFLSDLKDGYFITVTAVVNGSESEPAPSADGITFSYFHEHMVETKCYLDLPPVNVTAHQDNKVQISFANPFFFHCQKMKENKKKCPKKNHQDFNFKVKILNQTHSFICEDQMCMKTLPVDAAQQKHCVNITGETTEGILVKSKKLYCAEPFHEPSQSNLTAVYAVCGIVAVATIGLILFMAYQKLTTPTNSLPTFWVPDNQKSLFRPTNTPESVAVDHVEFPKRCDEVEPSSPTPLLTQTEEEDRTGFTDYDARFPIGVSENEDMCNVIREGQPNGEGPGYMAGNTDFDDENPGSGDENPLSGYEKRNKVLVALSPDESATVGYRGPVTHEEM